MAQNYQNPMDELEAQSSTYSATPLPNNEELIAALMQQVTNLSAQVAQLRNSGAAPAAAPVYVPVRAPEPKCADPEPFKGDKKELTTFLVKCRLKFEGEPSRFSKEDAKISGGRHGSTGVSRWRHCSAGCCALTRTWTWTRVQSVQGT